MESSYLGLLGLSRRAGKLCSGSEASREAISCGEAKLVIIASDASEKTRENFKFFAEEAEVCLINVTESAAELGNAIGKRPCAVLSVCDVGFSAAIVKKLADINNSAKEAAQRLSEKAERATARRKQRRAKQ